jgi:hypothetical protein
VCLIGFIGGAYLGASLAQNLTSNNSTEWNPSRWKNEPATYFGAIGGGLGGALIGYALAPGVVGYTSLTLGFEGLSIPLATLEIGSGVSVLGGLGYYAFEGTESIDQSKEFTEPIQPVKPAEPTEPTELDDILAQIQAEQNGTRVAFLETGLDILGLGYDGYQLYKNPNWENGAYFMASLAATAVPGVPGTWAFRGAARGGGKLVEGAHSVFKTHNGKVIHYETRIPQTNLKNPNPFETVKRFDGTGRGHFNKTTQQNVPTPHIHDPKAPGGVRAPLSDELPLGF